MITIREGRISNRPHPKAKLTSDQKKDPRAALVFTDGLYISGLGLSLAEVEESIVAFAQRFGFCKPLDEGSVSMLQCAVGYLNRAPGKPKGYNFNLENGGLWFRHGGRVLNSEYSYDGEISPWGSLIESDHFIWNPTFQGRSIRPEVFALGTVVLCMSEKQPKNGPIAFQAGYLIKSKTKDAPGQRAVRTFTGELLDLNEWLVVTRAYECKRRYASTVTLTLSYPSIKQVRALPSRKTRILKLS